MTTMTLDQVIRAARDVDTDSVATAIEQGVTTPTELARLLGVALIEDCLVLPRSPLYACSEGDDEVPYPADTRRARAARRYVHGGEWDWDVDTTTWVAVDTYRLGVDSAGAVERVDCERIKVAIEPDEPECIDDDGHDWRSPLALVGGDPDNPGVWGHGGGVVTRECCVRCGYGKVTDTWARDPVDGEEGLRSVSYDLGAYELEALAPVNPR